MDAKEVNETHATLEEVRSIGIAILAKLIDIQDHLNDIHRIGDPQVNKSIEFIDKTRLEISRNHPHLSV